MSAFNLILYETTTKQKWQSAAKVGNDWGGTLRSWLSPAPCVSGVRVC